MTSWMPPTTISEAMRGTATSSPAAARPSSIISANRRIAASRFSRAAGQHVDDAQVRELGRHRERLEERAQAVARPLPPRLALAVGDVHRVEQARDAVVIGGEEGLFLVAIEVVEGAARDARGGDDVL